MAAKAVILWPCHGWVVKTDRLVGPSHWSQLGEVPSGEAGRAAGPAAGRDPAAQGGAVGGPSAERRASDRESWKCKGSVSLVLLIHF